MRKPRNQLLDIEVTIRPSVLPRGETAARLLDQVVHQQRQLLQLQGLPTTAARVSGFRVEAKVPQIGAEMSYDSDTGCTLALAP